MTLKSRIHKTLQWIEHKANLTQLSVSHWLWGLLGITLHWTN